MTYSSPLYPSYLIITVFAVALGIAIFIAVRLLGESRHMFNIGKLKKEVERNPGIGETETGGVLVYKTGQYSLEYRIRETAGGKVVQWVSVSRRLTRHEEDARRVNKSIMDFFHYRKWLDIMISPAAAFLIIGVLLLYFGFIESEVKKIERFRWVIARTFGVKPDQIIYTKSGWIQISGTRKTYDGQHEDFSYVANPFSWLTFQQDGYIVRQRGDESVVYPLFYNSKGDLWLKRERGWEQGRIENGIIDWDKGREYKDSKVEGHDLIVEDGALMLDDK